MYTYIFLMLFLLCLHPSCTVNLVYHPDLQWPLRTRLAEYPACVVSRAFMAGAASQAGDADSSWAPGLTSGLQGSVNVHRGALLLVPQWQCISSFVFYSRQIYILTLHICWNFVSLLGVSPSKVRHFLRRHLAPCILWRHVITKCMTSQ